MIINLYKYYLDKVSLPVAYTFDISGDFRYPYGKYDS